MPQKRGARPTMAEAWIAFERSCVPDDAPEAMKLAFRFAWREAFASVARSVKALNSRHPELDWNDIDTAYSILLERHERERDAEIVALLRRNKI